MEKYFLLLAMLFCSTNIFGQNYERKSVCGTDTINVDYSTRKFGRNIQFRAFECTKVSKLGLRIDIGFNRYKYSTKTSDWLGNHNGPLIGLTFAYGNFNIGAKFKPATVSPKKEMEFNGAKLTEDAKLNPIKIDYDFGYSINFKHNISIEPYVALTVISFIVINEDDLGKIYNINRTRGLSIGTTLNKYFHIKGFQFVSVFAKYGYGLADFKKVNVNLGTGYSDFAIGIAYKGFIKKRFLKQI